MLLLLLLNIAATFFVVQKRRQWVYTCWLSSSESLRKLSSNSRCRSSQLNSIDGSRVLSDIPEKSILAERVFIECWFLNNQLAIDASWEWWEETYFLTIMNKRKNWTQFRITSRTVSKIASLRSPAEHPDAITIKVITHRPTRIVSMIFHTDFQYSFAMPK